MTRNARGDGGEEQGRHDHPNQAKEEIAGQAGMRGSVRRVDSEFNASKHCHEGPEQERRLANWKYEKSSDSGPAKGFSYCSLVSKRGDNAGREECNASDRGDAISFASGSRRSCGGYGHLKEG
jgi:hypothetical protein